MDNQKENNQCVAEEELEQATGGSVPPEVENNKETSDIKIKVKPRFI